MIFGMVSRDSLGGSTLAGDYRWAGDFGVNLDFVARSNCAVEVIDIHGIQVKYFFLAPASIPHHTWVLW